MCRINVNSSLRRLYSARLSYPSFEVSSDESEGSCINPIGCTTVPLLYLYIDFDHVFDLSQGFGLLSWFWHGPELMFGQSLQNIPEE